MDYISEELSKLYDKRKELAEQISNEFGDGDVFENVERYDNLMKELDSVNLEIDEINNYLKDL
jgi:hypothetical protein